MKTIQIKCKTTQPETEAVIEVQQYESIIEACDTIGYNNVLALINQEKVTRARQQWRADEFKRAYPPTRKSVYQRTKE